MAKHRQRITKIQAGRVPALSIISDTNAFLALCKNVVVPASESLSKLDNQSRVALQKLVYSHVVDNFDQLTDRILLWCATKVPGARKEILENMSKNPITMQRVYELFLLGDKAIESIEDEIIESSRDIFAQSNHANKVKKIANYIGWTEATKQNRVYATGKISQGALKGQSLAKSVPSSVVGFAHYLFARRSGVSHGDGKHFTKRDIDTIWSEYHVKIQSTFRIRPESIDTAVTFYTDLLNRFIDGVSQ